MPGPHYAISEALIVVVAVWVALRFAGRGAWLGAAGTGILGIAAAIGAYRFASGNIEALALLHRSVSQAGGASAMALVALQLIWAPAKQAPRLGAFSAAAFALATLLASLFAPAAATPLFIIWLVVAIGLAWRLPADGTGQRLLRASLASIFLANVLLVRQSSLLGPDMSWHLFHTLIAVWLFAIWWIWSAADLSRPASRTRIL